jgi:hypothetical protein
MDTLDVLRLLGIGRGLVSARLEGMRGRTSGFQATTGIENQRGSFCSCGWTGRWKSDIMVDLVLGALSVVGMVGWWWWCRCMAEVRCRTGACIIVSTRGWRHSEGCGTGFRTAASPSERYQRKARPTGSARSLVVTNKAETRRTC